MKVQKSSKQILQTNNKNLGQRFFTSIRSVEGEGNERKKIISFSSEEPYQRWFGLEILSHDETAVNLDRLNQIGVVLYNHKTDKVIGKINKAWIESGRGCAEIEFDDDEESEIIFQKVQNKTLKGVSVGYQVSEWEDVSAGETSSDGKYKGPCSIARKWMPYEISIVSVPADSTVGVERNFEEGSNNLDLYLKILKNNQNNL